MFYSELESYRDDLFQRQTGVNRLTFQLMSEVLNQQNQLDRSKGGPTPKLCVEDRLLLAMSYWREYRSYFHIGGDFNVSESTVQRTTEWVENTLIASNQFHLPKRQEWQGENVAIEVVFVDATEVEIERPKKSKNAITQARKRSIR